MPSPDDLVPSLRFALKHLYDPVALRQSPLIPRLGLSASAEPVSQLRQTLVRAIRALQPEAGVPADTQIWRVYEILLYRYVQRSSQLEVADQLGVSVRHLGRLEGQALQVLAEGIQQHVRSPADDGAETPGPDEPTAFGDELAWLAEADAGEAVHLEPILSCVLELVEPMAGQHGVTVDPSIPSDLLPLAVHPVALRQILLSLLGAAIRQAPGQCVHVDARALEWQVAVCVRAPRADDAKSAESDEAIAASLEMASRLADTCGGGVTVHVQGDALAVTATLPASEQTPVLVIDDNANTLRLLQRYASNTRYRIMPATTLAEGLILTRETTPRAIVLDVMMPEIDGWEVLGRLRQHPLTSHIPVVVCTILVEEDLALSLGAAGFLRKPVSREAFLEALDRAYLAERASR
jgi:CheY-like chemotaxis protein